MSSDGFDSLAELFSKLKFRRQIIGGLSEADVWKKLEEVQTEYRRLYELQAAGYEARLKEREDRICQLEEMLSANGRIRQPEEILPKACGIQQMKEGLPEAGGSRNEP